MQQKLYKILCEIGLMNFKKNEEITKIFSVSEIILEYRGKRKIKFRTISWQEQNYSKTRLTALTTRRKTKYLECWSFFELLDPWSGTLTEKNMAGKISENSVSRFYVFSWVLCLEVGFQSFTYWSLSIATVMCTLHNTEYSTRPLFFKGQTMKLAAYEKSECFVTTRAENQSWYECGFLTSAFNIHRCVT
jgi:hypothetical protein